MIRIIVVFLGLLVAVHVSVLGIPAPVPVLLVFAAVIGALGRLIWGAAGWRVYRKAAP